MTTTRKRLYEEISNFKQIDKPVPNARIHAAVTSLSPVKKGKTSIYFDGTMTDGDSHFRVVGFSSEQQKKLASFMDSKDPLELSNCEVKRSRQCDKWR